MPAILLTTIPPILGGLYLYINKEDLIQNLAIIYTIYILVKTFTEIKQSKHLSDILEQNDRQIELLKQILNNQSKDLELKYKTREYIPFQEDIREVSNEIKPKVQEELVTKPEVQEKLVTKPVLKEQFETKDVSPLETNSIIQKDNSEVKNTKEKELKTWFDTNIERIKNYNTRLGKQYTTSDKTIYGNYLKYSRFHNLDLYEYTEFLKNFFKILKLFKDLKHEEIRIGRSPAVSNIRLKN